MPKRLSESSKWVDVWYMNLSPQSKLLWEYVRDNCDLTGVYEVNLELMRFQTKFSEKVDLIKHLREFNIVSAKLGMSNRVEWFADERALWIVNFVKIQYGTVFLNENSSFHRGIIKVLEINLLKKGLPKGYITLSERKILFGKNKNSKIDAGDLNVLKNNKLKKGLVRVKDKNKNTLSKNKKELEENEELSEYENAEKNFLQKKEFKKPTQDEVFEVMAKRADKSVNAKFEAGQFVNFYNSNGWKVGKNKMEDWQASARKWIDDEMENPKPKYKKSEETFTGIPIDEALKRRS